MLSTLSADEKERAARFYFQRDREHFIVARGALRAILGRYLQRDPTRVGFRYSPHGKPALAMEAPGEGLRFNISHSHGLALCAVTRGREIGVDLERVRSIANLEQIAERFFSPGENAEPRALPARVKAEAFFNGWSRKEAYLKARGDGLSLSLDQFDVSLASGEPARLPRNQREPRDVGRWPLQELPPVFGYVAALAVEGHGLQIRGWQWNG